MSSTHRASAAILRRAALIQCIALIVLITGAWISTRLQWPWPPVYSGLLPAALIAAGLSGHWRLPPWWRWINMLFLPALLTVQQLALPAWLFALGFVLSLAVFGGVYRSRVPLWLSGRRARQALLEQLPANQPLRFIDLGGGFGGVAAAVARARPQAEVVAIEWALLPWLLGWLRLRVSGARVDWRRGSFWTHDFGDYDVVYAYLSPAPMMELWAKAQAELRPGARLISYRFAIPEHPADQIVPLGGPNDMLMIWRMGSKQASAVQRRVDSRLAPLSRRAEPARLQAAGLRAGEGPSAEREGGGAGRG